MYEAYALSGALSEATLVLFTTLAPSGAMAFVFMSIPLVFGGKHVDQSMQRGIVKYLSVPILVAMVGLVASATHLGSPANALYVLTGFGRSPLSNEVVFGVLFLGSGGIYWLTSFAAREKSATARRVVLVLISAFGLMFITAISLAYNASTIITWSSPFAIVAVWLNALIGGPLLALFGFRLARFYTDGHHLGKVLLVVSAVALVINIIEYVCWGLSLPSFVNSMTSADALAPAFFPMIVAFSILCACAIALSTRAVRDKGETPLWVLVCSCLLAFMGIYIMRLAFYMIHMTVGVGI